ncbi:MAG: hypothetical protein KAS71_19065, partial [Bacteroidales bacterium]|nr:hypothetical protein [Bacteroidales bacterium]
MEKLIFERPVIKKVSAGMPGKFGMKTGFEVLTTIDGVPIKDMLEKYGSPLYIISEQTIREKFRTAEKTFKSKYPKVQFAWSYKTNYLDAVCKTFHQEGSWAEVVSNFEYEKARSLGVPGDKIIFNGPYKNRQILETAINENARIHI